MNHYAELREALGIPQDASHEEALLIAGRLKPEVFSFKLPECLDTPSFQAAWTHWVMHRKEKKLSSYKPIGMKSQFTKLAAMGAVRAIAAIEFSISQNYQGIFEPNGTSKKHHQGTARSSKIIGTEDRYRIGPGVHGNIG